MARSRALVPHEGPQYARVAEVFCQVPIFPGGPLSIRSGQVRLEGVSGRLGSTGRSAGHGERTRCVLGAVPGSGGVC